VDAPTAILMMIYMMLDIEQTFFNMVEPVPTADGHKRDLYMDSQGTHERSRVAADLPASMIAVYENQSGTSH
jgi:hypothetical protein